MYSREETVRQGDIARQRQMRTVGQRRELFGVEPERGTTSFQSFNSPYSARVNTCGAGDGDLIGSSQIPYGWNRYPDDREERALGVDDQATLAELRPDIQCEESTFEETGLTATYELLGFKSLPPSSTKSKQRVALIHYSDVVFSRVVVAKYKCAVFLEATVRN